MGRAKPIVAIDGPAGSGKSTLAKLAANKLGFVHIDTGALYRSVAWKSLETNADFENKDSISTIAEELSVRFEHAEGGNRVLVDGEDVSKAIRDNIKESLFIIPKHCSKEFSTIWNSYIESK